MSPMCAILWASWELRSILSVCAPPNMWASGEKDAELVRRATPKAEATEATDLTLLMNFLRTAFLTTGGAAPGGVNSHGIGLSRERG
eukprot:CAMPEP_0169462594 /NCGR_PEP_ID=MMETSP1042-20121227/19650_1 /TAXON_ID=464988 /ORGANISM="Hemiselmis andersenii, Strain CCMP1180" /LENGTH=86 /DNA_ID=CAMNT_0009575255 /DNA_START=280 /DNA_END=536 /DNA_ORIENTATION=-